jgi:hypothetical protein
VRITNVAGRRTPWLPPPELGVVVDVLPGWGAVVVVVVVVVAAVLVAGAVGDGAAVVCDPLAVPAGAERWELPHPTSSNTANTWRIGRRGLMPAA